MCFPHPDLCHCSLWPLPTMPAMLAGQHVPGLEGCRQVGCSPLRCFYRAKFTPFMHPVCGEALSWGLVQARDSSLLVPKGHLKPVPEYHHVSLWSECGLCLWAWTLTWNAVHTESLSSNLCQFSKSEIFFPPLSCETSKKLLSTIKIITVLRLFGAYTLGKLPAFVYAAASYSPQDCLLFVLVYINIIADPLLLHPARNESSEVPCQSGTGQIWKTSWKTSRMNVVVDCFSKGLAEGPPEKGWRQCNALWLLPVSALCISSAR